MDKSKYIAPGILRTQPTKVITMTLDQYLEGAHGIKRDALSARAKLLVNGLETYVSKMQPNVMKTRDSIVANQKAYLNTLEGILSSETTEAVLLWELVLWLANKHHLELFNDRTLNQHYDKLPEGKQLLFTKLNALIIGTADVNLRKGFIRNYPLSSLDQYFTNPQQKVSLAAFYAKNLTK